MIDPIVEQCCQRHPGHVAGVLRGQPSQEVNEFLTALAPDLAARVMCRLDGQQLSAALALMDPASLARVIASAGHEESVELIAHLSNARYDELINSDPSHGRQLASRLYAFSKKTLGAIANPEFVRVKSGSLCGRVTEDLTAGHRDHDEPVYLVDEKGVLLGALPLLAVIAQKNAHLEVDKLKRPIQPLSDRTTVEAALEARQWSTTAVLPVVDGAKRLIGTVSRPQLLRLTLHERDDGHGLEQLTGDLAGEYLKTCASLLELALQGRSSR